jgi:hypothetical protein
MPKPPSRPTELVAFPPAWTWLVDEAIPAYVKERYSPRESWKGKPFGKEDVRFFFKGIEELSELFTEDRGSMPAYFNHPRFRSAYLLYFLPMQAAKFVALFERHPAAIEAALKDGGTLRVADLGAGPGTASLALLLYLLARGPRELPAIELDWYDNQASILADGQALVLGMASAFPRLRGKVTVRTHTTPWWKIAHQETSLVLVGNVLNESPAPAGAWNTLLERVGGGGALIVEPASRQSSQALSQLRDDLLENEALEPTARSFWGPCPHAERCPLATGRDYCHFSVPVRIPGNWFREFSVGLGSERQWVKFSYLWIASRAHRAPPPPKGMKLVLSDPLKSASGTSVLLCEPERPGRLPVSSDSDLRRGDLIRAP